jgi:fluoride exporter
VTLDDHGEEYSVRDRSVLAVISAGGVVGALGRFGLGVLFPSPWTTFAINLSGCLLIGMLMVLVDEVWPPRRLVRPFLGTGVLGGYTTFSTYAVDVTRGAGGVAYLVGTLVGALVAVYAGMVVTRWLVRKESR